MALATSENVSTARFHRLASTLDPQARVQLLGEQQAILMGDNVNSNEVPLGSAFPFFAPPNQPLENPAVDNTQN